VALAKAENSEQALTPADQVMLAVLHEHQNTAPVAALKVALVTSGRATNANAADTLVAFAPYLRSASRGWLTGVGSLAC
jgi:hypothetical protein